MKNNAQDQSSAKLIIGIISAFVAAVVVFFLFTGKVTIDEITQIASSTSSMTYDNPIPYIFPESFRSQLLNFVYNDSHSQTLLIIGPSGSGKSRGMVEFSQELASNKTLVLNLDFKHVGPYISTDDLLYNLHRDVPNSLKAVDNKNFPAQQIIPILNRYIAGLNLSSINMTNKTAKNLYRKFQNPLLKNVSMCYDIIFEYLRVSPPLAFRTLLEMSEAISKYVQVVLLINEPENLITCQNSKFGLVLELFWEILRDFYGNEHSLPVITEVSDQSMITLHKLPFDHNQFLFLYMPQFKYKEAEKVLVSREKLFTKQELHLLYDALGGHGQSVAYAHELFREGYTLGESLMIVKESSRNQVLRSLKLASNETKIAHYLKKVLSHRIFPVNYDEEAAVYLLKNKIATLVNGTKVELGSKAITAATSDVLSS